MSDIIAVLDISSDCGTKCIPCWSCKRLLWMLFAYDLRTPAQLFWPKYTKQSLGTSDASTPYPLHFLLLCLMVNSHIYCSIAMYRGYTWRKRAFDCGDACFLIDWTKSLYWDSLVCRGSIWVDYRYIARCQFELQYESHPLPPLY